MIGPDAPGTNDAGHLDTSWFETSSPDKIAAWLRALLAGEVALLPVPLREPTPPHVGLRRTWNRVAPLGREGLRLACLLLLNDAADRSGDWDSGTLDRLMLLTEPFFLGSAEETRAVGILQGILHRESVNLGPTYLRVLQSLAALRVPLPASTWRQYWKTIGPGSESVIALGLLQNSVEYLAEWYVDEADNVHVREAVYRLLPLAFRTSGGNWDIIVSAFQAQLAGLPPALIDELRDRLRRFGGPPLRPPGRLIDRAGAKDRLNRLLPKTARTAPRPARRTAGRW